MTFATMPDFIGALVGALLTLLVLSYLVGDNPLFRVTIYMFIGVSAGFAGAVAMRSVIVPYIFYPLLNLLSGDVSRENLLSLVPVLLSLLMLAKLSTRLSKAGSVAMAFLVGVGAAVAIGGTLVGTLFPQITASINLFDWANINSAAANQGGSSTSELFNRLLILAGTVSTLVYFHFSARAIPNAIPQRSAWIEQVGKVGQGFIAVTFGVIFAGVFAAAITALIERVYFLWSLLLSFL